PMNDPDTEELLRLSHQLVDSIARNDYATYEQLSDPGLTGIEPQSFGTLLEGLEFHKYNMSHLGFDRTDHRTTIAAPRVRLLGKDVAIVTCTRINQRVTTQGAMAQFASLETRIWQRQSGRWKHVHFHRSDLVMSK